MMSSNGNIFLITGHLCGEFTITSDFPAQRPVTQSFDIFFDLRLNKWLNKQWWGCWFEMPWHLFWHHCHDLAAMCPQTVLAEISIDMCYMMKDYRDGMVCFFNLYKNKIFLYSLHTERQRVIQMLVHRCQGPFYGIHSPCHSGWWPGTQWSQGISSHVWNNSLRILQSQHQKGLNLEMTQNLVSQYENRYLGPVSI